MALWKEHMEFCIKHGIDEEICKFANRLVDFPEEIIPKLLKDERLKKYLVERLNLTFEELERIREETEIVWRIKTNTICNYCSFREKCKFKNFKVKPSYYYLAKGRKDYVQTYVVIHVQRNGTPKKLCFNEYKFNKYKDIIIMPDSGIDYFDFKEYRMNCPIPPKHSKMRDYYPNSIYHNRLHDYSVTNPYIKLIKEIARYFYGENGVKAVELHFDLDEFSHVMSDLRDLISAYLSRGLSGKTSDRKTRRYMACSSFIKKYIFDDPLNVLYSLKPSNLHRLKQNLSKLLQMTVEEFFSEYKRKYEGALKEKKIIDVIREFQMYFGRLPELIERLCE